MRLLNTILEVENREHSNANYLILLGVSDLTEIRANYFEIIWMHDQQFYVRGLRHQI